MHIEPIDSFESFTGPQRDFANKFSWAQKDIKQNIWDLALAELARWNEVAAELTASTPPADIAAWRKEHNFPDGGAEALQKVDMALANEFPPSFVKLDSTLTPYKFEHYKGEGTLAAVQEQLNLMFKKAKAEINESPRRTVIENIGPIAVCTIMGAAIGVGIGGTIGAIIGGAVASGALSGGLLGGTFGFIIPAMYVDERPRNRKFIEAVEEGLRTSALLNKPNLPARHLG
jgi:hypothetical protein